MNGIKEPLVVNLKSLDIRKPAIQAANYLTKGGVIATPTDTIYGLAAIANNSEAVKRIYEIKGEFVIWTIQTYFLSFIHEFPMF